MASDAIWPISRGVTVPAVRAGRLAFLPLDTADTVGPISRTTRADDAGSTELALLRDAIPDNAGAV
ncbi:MAG: hypothetical protein JJ920_16680 [Roseitalea sp.]|nr:hypothetical protein [Roseitalea sp.]MBO6721366.1 hypothetical protein [Roseitalea sp.]MBO6744551.1 hypothetical protein [Roseitalea sp.]